LYEEFVEKLSNPDIADNGVPEFLDKYNRIFQSFGSIDEAKMDLFKRIDIYSFGMIILFCVGSYLNYKRRSTIDEEYRELMMRLYAFVYKCCNQTERVVDINELIAEYQGIVAPVQKVAQSAIPPPVSSPIQVPTHPYPTRFQKTKGLVRMSPLKLHR
jgi:hypothetical protein